MKAQNLFSIKLPPFSSPQALGTQDGSQVLILLHLWGISYLPSLSLINTDGEQEDKLDYHTRAYKFQIDCYHFSEADNKIKYFSCVLHFNNKKEELDISCHVFLNALFQLLPTTAGPSV